MNEIEKYNITIFESIKHIDENGLEYWEACARACHHKGGVDVEISWVGGDGNL